jgi:hypothetical protein
VNLEISKGQVPVLEPPVRPTPDDVKEGSSPNSSVQSDVLAGPVKYSKLLEDEKCHELNQCRSCTPVNGREPVQLVVLNTRIES